MEPNQPKGNTIPEQFQCPVDGCTAPVVQISHLDQIRVEFLTYDSHSGRWIGSVDYVAYTESPSWFCQCSNGHDVDQSTGQLPADLVRMFPMTEEGTADE
jgi:hypothetical protein